MRPAASLYAVVRSDWACKATASAAWMVPLTMPGGKPGTAVPGMTPRSPLIVVGPVLVTVWPARTPKLSAVPRPTGGCAASAALVRSARAATETTRDSTIMRAPLTGTPEVGGRLLILESMARAYPSMTLEN